MDRMNVWPFLQLTIMGFWEIHEVFHKWSFLCLGYVFDGTKMLDDMYKNLEKISKVRYV